MNSSESITTPEERASIVPGSPLWGEHRSRYLFAAQFVKSKRVLDIACGTGFGAQILINAGAVAIVAADYSEEALSATRGLKTPNTHLLRADGTRLPFGNDTFDAITSFETVEHIENYEGFVADLRRVLKTDGVMVMSTPNAYYTRPVNGKPVNPFHVHEFTPEEFETLLRKHFPSVELYGQRVTDEFRICPYWELPDMLPTDIVSKARIAAWKVQVRLPEVLRERISRLTRGKQFFPGEDDFVFSADELRSGYVQVAVCRF